METLLAREARKKQFSYSQLKFILGTLLGDGHLVKTTRGYALRINHSFSQKELVDWKYKQISCFVNSIPKKSGKAYYFRTVTHPLLNKWRTHFYKERIKVIPKRLLETLFDGFTLAVWVMDDGTKEGKQFRINTQSFTFKENLWLIRFLWAKLGIGCSLNKDKDRYRLRVKNASMERFILSVRPYFISSMLYKLPL